MSYFGLVRRNLTRNKLRSTFTGLAIALAVVLVCLLLTMPAGLDSVIQEATNDARVSVHHKAGLVYPLPLSLVRKVRDMDGVKAAMGTQWFGGAFEEPGKVTFPNFAVEAEHFPDVYPDYPVDPDQMADFVQHRDTALVGGQVMDKYGWEVGDRISLESTLWPVVADLRIAARIDSTRAPTLYLHLRYVDEAMKAAGETGMDANLGMDSIGTIWFLAERPENVGPLMRQIDDLTRNSPHETASETEKSYFQSFFGQLQGMIQVILIVTGLLTLCIVFIAANTASMSVRERAGELAVMKAIGFGRRTLFGTLFVEALLLSSVAGALGVGGAFGFTALLQFFAGLRSDLGMLGQFTLTSTIVVQGLFLSLFVGMLAGIVPSWGASRKPVVEALREIF